MGKDSKDTTLVDQIEDIVGLTESTEANGSVSQEEATTTSQTPATEETTEADTSSAQQATEQSNALTKEILKIDLEIETLTKQSVDVADFYNNLEDELNEEEQQLEFTDKPAYMKLVNEKAKAYEAKHSPAATIAELEAKKEDLIGVQERRSALQSVQAKYPSVDVDKVFDFFTNKLNKEQQDEINTASSYAEVYEKTFKKYLESNSVHIHQQTAPTIPDVNSVRKQELDTQHIEDGLSSEEEKLHEALGFQTN